MRIPLAREEISVTKRAVETDRVRVRSVLEETRSDVHATVSRQDVVVERRPVERQVAEMPEPWQEGDLLIVPVVEERAVIEKRLFVVEELVVRRVTRTEDVQIPTTLRSMRAVVERDGVEQP